MESQSMPLSASMLRSNTMPADSFLLQQIDRMPSMTNSEHTVQRTYTTNLDSPENSISQNLQRITRESLKLDKISCQVGGSIFRPGKTIPSLHDTLVEFALVKPSDDLLLRERKYLEQRRALIVVNLKAEIDRIASIDPDVIKKSGADKKKSFTSGQGKNMNSHYKQVFKEQPEAVIKIQQMPEMLLKYYIQTQLEWLLEQQQIIQSSIFGGGKQRGMSDVQNLLNSQNLLEQLGNPQQNVTASAIDEKMFLDQKRLELDEFELLVFKLSVVVERVNYYTTGIIFPRDQNLNIIPFFDATYVTGSSYVGPRSAPLKQSTIQYDYQSCLKIISAIKSQIDRLEIIEIQQGTVLLKQQYTNLNSSTLSQDFKGVKNFQETEKLRRSFNELRTEMKEKKTMSEDSKKVLEKQFKKFTGNERLDLNIQVMLHMELINIRPTFEEEGFRIEHQLYYMQKKPFSQLYRVETGCSRLFTEINFLDHLVLSDFVMIFKVYKETTPGAMEKERVIPNYKEKTTHRFYKAFAVINIFDLILQDQLNFNTPYKHNLLHFYEVQPGQCIDELYPAFCTEQRKEEVSNKNKFQYSQQITRHLQIQLQLTFMPINKPLKLQLRIDKAIVCRPKRFWDKMVRRVVFTKDFMETKDILFQQKQEIDQFNLNIMQEQDVHNYIRIDLKSLLLKEKAHRIQNIMRIQVYLYSSDSKDRSSINIKFLENFYRYPNERNNLEFFYQSNISAQNIGKTEFYNQFFVKLPNKTSLQDLEKFKLVYLIQFPTDQQKTTEKITEQHLESDPGRFQFKTYFFARQQLYDPATELFAGFSDISNSTELKLMEFKQHKQQKNFTDTFEGEQIIIKDASLIVQLYLISQQYSTSREVRQIIEPNLKPALTSYQILDLVKAQSNNELLIYHQRMLDSLIYMFLNAQGESQKKDLDTYYLAIVIIIERFHSDELSAFLPLMRDYNKKWNGVDRDNDKKLFNALQQKIQRIQEDLSGQLEIQNKYSESSMLDMAMILRHLPDLLNFLFKLFSREFEIQYAQIRQLINSKLKRFLERDLCIYRPDIYETNQTPKRTTTSRPQLIILYLEEDIKKIKAKYQEQQQNQKGEMNSNESDSGENNFTQDALEGDQFKFDDRISSYQSKRSTFRDDSRVTNDGDVDTYLAKLDALLSGIKRYHIDFSVKVKTCILQISQDLHCEPEFYLNLEPDSNFLSILQNFSGIVKPKLAAYYDKIHLLREVFWSSLQSTLEKMINFIDQKFVFQLFDDQYLLRTIQPALQVLIEGVIPGFEEIIETEKKSERAIQSEKEISEKVTPEDEVNFQAKNPGRIFEEKEMKAGIAAEKYKELVNNAKKTRDFIKKEEEMKIDDEILQKVTMFSDILSSDAFILLPNEPAAQKPASLKSQYQESLQQIIAAKISKSVFNHIKAFKNTKPGDRKNTNIAEMTMYFLYRMSEFENKYLGSINHNNSLVQPTQTNLSVLIADEMPIDEVKSRLADSFKSNENFNLEEDDPLLQGLSQNVEQNYPIVEVQEEEETDAIVTDSLGLKVQNHKSNYPPVLINRIEKKHLPNNLLNSQVIMNKAKGINVNLMMDSMKQGLGAKQEFNFKDTDLLNLDFETGQEKRLAFFLRETEDVLARAKELDQYDLPHVKKLKDRYISLFQVLTMQHLLSLNQNSFKLYYEKRPGCLDRLVKEVRHAKNAYASKLDDFEFFFKLKALQSIEQFCQNVISFLCNPFNKKYIQELTDKYTYKSIVSQTWLLQLSIWAEEAKQHFDFKKKMSLFYQDDSSMQKIAQMLLKRMQRHSEMQELLWQTYEDMGDMILPEDSNVIYTGIQEIVKEILKEDLEDAVLETAIYYLVNDLLRPLAQIYAQIDELHFKCRNKLSSSVFTNFEKFIREIVEVDKNSIQSVLAEKRQRVCDLFCKLHESAIQQLRLDDPEFQKLIQARSKDFKQIKDLYLKVNKYEQKKNSDDSRGNLLAQLISFNTLMETLQQHNLSVSFQSHIRLKYYTLVKNINETLRKELEAEKERAQEDPDNFSCQKNDFLYQDQMKEVRAFMHVQNYITYKNAVSAGEMKALGDKNVQQSINIINEAVKALVPDYRQSTESKANQNQFFDVALNLLSEKRALLEKSYDFQQIKNVLDEQKNMYSEYAEFQVRKNYCQYYRVAFEPLLPEEMQVKDRVFIYRTPFGYQQEFIKDDIAILLNHQKDKSSFMWKGVGNMSFSQACTAKPVIPLTAEIKEKYEVPKDMMDLSEVGEDKYDNEKAAMFKQYYLDNFKKYFFIEEFKPAQKLLKDNEEYANFKDEYVLTIYEVKNKFPTMTMLQSVQKVYEKKVTRVRITLWDVQQFIRDIQTQLRQEQTQSGTVDDATRAANLQTYVHKYITGDDVQGGLPKLLELYFHKNLADEFNKLGDDTIKRAYLELFKNLELCSQELFRLVEVYALYSRNPVNTSSALERLEKRSKDLEAKRVLFNLHQLQENF